PVALVVCAAAVALVDDDEIEKVRRIFAEIGRGLGGRAIRLNGILLLANTEIGVPGTAHKGLEDGEKEAGVFGVFAFLADFVGFDARHSIFGKSGEGVVGLVGEDIAVREKEDAGT